MIKKIDKICIVGTGAWGTALAHLASYNVRKILFYNIDQEKINKFNIAHINRDYFPDRVLSNNIIGICNVQKCQDIQALIFVVPAQNFRQALNIFLPIMRSNKETAIVICSKGIENRSKKFLSQIIEEIDLNNPLVILSGPNFAKEIIIDKLSVATVASKDRDALDLVEKIFCSSNFKLEKISDVIGLQICGAAKNVYAIGAGMIAGLELGENFHAAFMKAVINEMHLILYNLKADPETIFSYGGIGDLFLTCSSTTSRNFEFGYMLAKGCSVQELLARKTIEGYYTLACIQTLIDNKQKIIDILYHIIYNDNAISLITKII